MRLNVVNVDPPITGKISKKKEKLSFTYKITGTGFYFQEQPGP
jgi:hypothetical protein